MSDPQVPNPETPIGDPVVDRPVVDDVVGSANAGLADAEAAREGVAGDDTPAAVSDEPVFSDVPAHTTANVPAADELYEPASADSSASTDSSAPAEGFVHSSSPRAADPVGDEVPWYDRPEAADDLAAAAALPAVVAAAPAAAASTPAAYTPPAASTPDAYTAPATVAPADSAPRDTAYAPIAPAALQPIFVQAPEAPRPRGNRAAAGAIGLVAAVAFAVLYLAVWLGVDLLTAKITVDELGESALSALMTFTLWVPTVVFFIAFWLLGGIINRGRWGNWVVLGLLVGVASYFGHIFGALFQEPFWMLTAREGATLAAGELLAPSAIAAFVIGRELTIWFGAWVAARGKRMTELNTESQREYERTLEAGPQLVQQ